MEAIIQISDIINMEFFKNNFLAKILLLKIHTYRQPKIVNKYPEILQFYIFKND